MKLINSYDVYFDNLKDFVNLLGFFCCYSVQLRWSVFGRLVWWDADTVAAHQTPLLLQLL